MNLELLDKVVLITRGAKRIGAATARALAQEGIVPVIGDRDAEAGEKLSAELRRDAAQSLARPPDLTWSGNCSRLVEQTSTGRDGRTFTSIRKSILDAEFLGYWRMTLRFRS